MIEKNQFIKREGILRDICLELSQIEDFNETMRKILVHIKNLTNYDNIHVAIRLHEKGDFPYYFYDGFSDTFIKKENYVCDRENDTFDCMCGGVISGEYDSDLPFFTEHGSFWTNNAEEVLKNKNNFSIIKNIRETCVLYGYKSVLLIPVIGREKNIGLIQINSKKKNAFDEDLVMLLETVGVCIGMGISNILEYKAKQKINSEIKAILNITKKLQKENGNNGINPLEKIGE